MTQTNATQRYRESRDALIAMRGKHEEAVQSFTWPDLGEQFNWAIDWFDSYARGNGGTALTIVEEDGASASYTFDEMVTRSDQVASWLAAQGVRKGDPIILMLGNQVELWDSMLAVMKLGAIIMPTTTAAGTSDLVDRIERGGARFVITNAS